MRRIFEFLLVCFLVLIPLNVMAAGGMIWDEVQLTDTALDSIYPDMVTDGTNVYYVYIEDDGTGTYQLWTAVSDMDGSNFLGTKRTSYTTDGVPAAAYAIEVVGGKVYLSWLEMKTAAVYELWTASMDTDGSNWSAVQQTNDGSVIKVHISMDVHNGKVFLTWHQTDAGNAIYTAIMDTDGSNFVKTKRTPDGQTHENPQIIATDSRVYVMWREWGPGLLLSELNLGYMNFDGSGWTEVNLTSQDAVRVVNDIVTDGTYLYAVWYEGLNNFQRLMYARMNLDGSDFDDRVLFSQPYTPPVPGSDYDFIPHIDIDGNQIYVVWEDYVDSAWETYTGVLDLDDGEWRHMQRLTDASNTLRARFDIYNDKIYYAFTDTNNIYLAIESNIDIVEEGATVEATVPSTLSFVVTGVSSGAACSNSGGNASVTTTASTIPFGTYTGAATRIACQTLTVSTNATNGYVITVEQDQDLTSGGGDTMNPFLGTYATPAIWSNPPGSGTESYFGFTTDDTDYSDFQTAKYGSFALTNNPYAIVVETDPVEDEANVISYQLEVTDLQPAGIYTNNIMYIATAIF